MAKGKGLLEAATKARETRPALAEADIPAKARPFREADLYPPVRDFLIAQGYTVRAEVKHCDVAATRPRQQSTNGEQVTEGRITYAAVKEPMVAASTTGNPDDPELLVVELKRGLTLALLSQGVKRQREADLVYLAIPRPKRFWFDRTWRDLLHVLRRLELGLMLVDMSKLVEAATAASRVACLEVVLDPVAFDRARSQSSHKRHRRGLLAEIKGRSADHNIGGSTRVKLMTAYRENALRIANLLTDGQARSPAELRRDKGDTKTAQILRNNVYGWFDHPQKGKYCLSPAGFQAIAEQSPSVNKESVS